MALTRVVSEIFNVEKYRDLDSSVRSHSRSSKLTRIYLSATYDFLLTFHSNYSYFRELLTSELLGLSRTVSEINSNFSRKSPIFLPRVFNAPGEFGYGPRVEKN